jgi:hypothetical protein
VKERERLTIRSFRVVFDLERRIHRIDRWRIPTPYGLPLRGVAYWALALLSVLSLGRLPLTAEVTAVLPPAIRFVIVPVAIAFMLTRLRVDGRPAHTALAGALRLLLSPPRLSAFRAAPQPGTTVRLADVAVVPDDRSARYRSAVIEGPAAVLLRYPPLGSVRGIRRPALHVRQLPGPPLFVGKQVRVSPSQRIVFHRCGSR